jgi:hypothetical protein
MTKRKRSIAKNNEHGAALAIAVLNFVRPYFLDEALAISKVSGHCDLTREDGYEQTVDRIIADYCPNAPDHIGISISSEVRRLSDILSSSNALRRALAAK